MRNYLSFHKGYFIYILGKQTVRIIFSRKKKILLVVTLNLEAPCSHMPGTIFLQRCVIKGRVQTDCKERRWKRSGCCTKFLTDLYRNTSENNFAAALSLPSPSVVSKGSVKLSALLLDSPTWRFAQKKCVFSPLNNLVKSFAKKNIQLMSK